MPPQSSTAGCQVVGEEPRRADHGARVPGAVGEVVAEQLALVGDHDHLVVGQILREARDLLLDLLEPAVGAAAAGIVLELALLDDLEAEALGGAAQRLGLGLVLRGGADDQGTSLLPLLPGEVLAEGIGEHGSATAPCA